MRRATIMLLTLLALCVTAAGAAEDGKIVQRPLARLRSGPGPIFPVVEMVKGGTLVKAPKSSPDGRWLQVRALSAKGEAGDLVTIKEWQATQAPWIATRDLSARRRPEDKPLQMATDREVKVVGASVAACVRGFDEKVLEYLESKGLKRRTLERVLTVPFTAREYLAFRQARLGKGGFRALRPPMHVPEDFLSAVQMDQLAAVVGTELAQRLGTWISKDEDRQKYVALIGTLLGEASPRYDITFRFLLIDDAKPNSFSAPGGIVIITTGLLDACGDEAEFASILAHEISHTVLRHGQRTQENVAKAVGGDMMADFQDLEAHTKTPPQLQEAEKQLATMAEWFLSVTLMRERRIQEETEADRMALYLLARCGYQPEALLRVVKRVGERSKNKVFEMRPLRNHPTTEDRLKTLQRALKPYRDPKGRHWQNDYLERAAPPAEKAAQPARP